MIQTFFSLIFFSSVFDVEQSGKLKMRRKNGKKDVNDLAAAILTLVKTTMQKLIDSSHSLRMMWIELSAHGTMGRLSTRMGIWTADSSIF